MENELFNLLIKFILAALGIVGTYALTRLSSFLDAKKSTTVATEGAINYNRALEVGKGLYLLLEKEFSGITKAGLDKKSEMEKRLLEIFPQISAVELAAINKTVSDEIKEKIITPLLTPDVPKTLQESSEAIEPLKSTLV